MWGLTGVQKEAVLAAKRSLVTVEEIVDELDPRPNAVVLELGRVCVSVAPHGAHPSYAHDYYERDNAYYREWDAICKRPRHLRRLARGAAPGGGGVTRRRRDDDRGGGGALPDGAACFVGIGLPSTAANLARRTHAPELVLIYEAGAIGAKPGRLPMSIGDGVLAETADAVVTVPEIFNYWLQPGRIEIGFLGAAQIDRFANINTTVIGPDYDNPKVRLPGAGGAPEIAASCGEVVVIVRQTHALVRRARRLRHLGRLRPRPGRPRAARAARPRPAAGDHRPRRARARPGDVRADADRGAPRRRRRPGAPRRRAGSSR